MSDTRPRLILTLNVGSASLKFAIYCFGITGECVLSGHFDRVGLHQGRFLAQRVDGTPLEDTSVDLPDFEAAMTQLLRWLPQHLPGESLAAVGHRVVHGGRDFAEPTRITPEVVRCLQTLVPLAPNHLPASIAVIDAATKVFPAVPHVACFDTAFHRTMPAVARRYGLPRALYDAGIQRYGFHGLSYQFIVEELTRLDSSTNHRRVVIAHLGNGASLCAVVAGQSVDTTMGLTPASGLVMGTRCGDIDPEIPLYLAQERGMTPSAIRNLLGRESGLLGVSGLSADVRELLVAEKSDPHAADALDTFCYSARKGIAAMTAAAGGLDTLVFTAGIGTHSPAIRARISSGLEYLGIHIDPVRNAANTPIISPEEAKVTIRVIPTNEEQLIARFTAKLSPTIELQ
jgi:acetate kinase